MHSRSFVNPPFVVVHSLSHPPLVCVLFILLVAVHVCNAIVVERRSFLENAGQATLLLGALMALDVPAAAASSSSSPVVESIYIGCGCFWHLQHSVAMFERDQLGRKGGQLTAKTGYAGGLATTKMNTDTASSIEDGRVCYHNPEGIADYGQLGYAEVVGVQVPTDRMLDMIQVYFDNFDANTKDRRDPMDLGSEYRSILGLPGGIQHPQYASIKRAAKRAGFRLQTGKGRDPDTLGTQLVYVYDTLEFPFHQAEIYHQFHNDFQSLPYGPQYNNLASRAFEDGRLQTTGCPDRLPPLPSTT
ncbi:expressed unknown protein [Seminavis robusta]|uniref:Peptide-methionine (S)-S-oxide reductase n=1 Tax=Seminavis robusta TaxID=568900 RepID=A0A9N8H5D6_9STRA|nr:expressed unknown protein [Seminavis robusta]|eukprot:Sro21_g014940.1 n/a (302) ;mRNA; f:147948-149032